MPGGNLRQDHRVQVHIRLQNTGYWIQYQQPVNRYLFHQSTYRHRDIWRESSEDE